MTGSLYQEWDRGEDSKNQAKSSACISQLSEGDAIGLGDMINDSNIMQKCETDWEKGLPLSGLGAFAKWFVSLKPAEPPGQAVRTVWMVMDQL